MSNRIKKVESLIKEELSKILSKEVDFPQDVLVTITRCQTSIDLKEARVHISVMPDEEAVKVFQILNRKIYDIQQALNKRLKMRPIPKIGFVREEKTKQAARVEELLEELKKE